MLTNFSNYSLHFLVDNSKGSMRQYKYRDDKLFMMVKIIANLYTLELSYIPNSFLSYRHRVVILHAIKLSNLSLFGKQSFCTNYFFRKHPKDDTKDLSFSLIIIFCVILHDRGNDKKIIFCLQFSFV